VSKTRRRFTRILLFSVSILGFLSAILLLNDPPSAESDGVTGLFALNSSILASERGLASVVPDHVSVPSPDTLMQLDCSENSQILHTGSARFRIKGPLCPEPGSGIVSAEVLNVSNGYVATVFHQAGQFTTDYINLSEGKNEISVKFTGESGIIQKTITVLRNTVAKIQD
jgi:hypothetical protein